MMSVQQGAYTLRNKLNAPAIAITFYGISYLRRNFLGSSLYYNTAVLIERFCLLMTSCFSLMLYVLLFHILVMRVSRILSLEAGLQLSKRWREISLTSWYILKQSPFNQCIYPNLSSIQFISIHYGCGTSLHV